MLDLQNIAIAVLAVALGTILGKILKMVRGERWRNSIRGLLFATALIAIALTMLVLNWKR